MNKSWSEINKNFQNLIKNKDTFKEGISQLITLREKLYSEIKLLLHIENKDLLWKNPFRKDIGNESKTVIYSIYHIFRIEDIVCNVLIMNKETDIFLSGKFQEKLNSSLYTTGNELTKFEMLDFSKQINQNGLIQYIDTVYNVTNKMLQNLCYEELKMKISEKIKNEILSLKVVSEDEKAFWLINYWSSKNIKGFLQMPLSRHWIMHIEASKKIINKLCNIE